jgi:hypothetical protein
MLREILGDQASGETGRPVEHDVQVAAITGVAHPARSGGRPGLPGRPMIRRTALGPRPHGIDGDRGGQEEDHEPDQGDDDAQEMSPQEADAHQQHTGAHPRHGHGGANAVPPSVHAQ